MYKTPSTYNLSRTGTSQFGSNAGFSLFQGQNATWIIIAIILAIIGGILLYFLFVKSKTEFKGFWAKLRHFLDFKQLVIEPILKVLYYILAIYITLLSFGLISVSFLSFLLTLVLGNLTIRVIYEMLLMGVVLCRNVSEINTKLKK